MSIIYDKKFIKNIEDFVFTNDKKYIKNIVKYKSQIPSMFKTAKVLFRGMVLTYEEIYNIKAGEKLKLADYSSWTLDPKIAKKFVTDKFKVMKNVGPGIIFRRTNLKPIINIQALIMFLDSTGNLDDFDELNKEMAIDEAECICNKGIILSKKDIFKEY